MQNKKDSNRIDPRKDYGWEVTDEELEENFLLFREAGYMAHYFALNSTSLECLNFAEEFLQRLQQQSIFPFPLPEKGFSVAQGELIISAEQTVDEARTLLHVVTKPGVVWRGIDDVSKADLDRFHEKFTQVTAAFRGGEESFLYHSGSGGTPGSGEKKEKIVGNPPPTGEGVLSPVFDNNLRLAYEAIVRTKFAATHAGVPHKKIYEDNLRAAQDFLKHLKNKSKAPSLFPQRGYTLAQVKMRLDLENYAKEAYKAFHCAFDDAKFPIDGGITRKASLDTLYREFNPKGKKGPQPNIKSFLGSDFFHRKRPNELLIEKQDFWETPEGKVYKNRSLLRKQR